MHRRVAFRWLESLLLLVGLLLVGLWFKNDTEARAFLAAESKKLAAAQREANVAGPHAQWSPKTGKTAWMPVTLASGVFGRIEIPRLGISALIAEGTKPAQLDRAVGHIVTTAFPGQPGNCALAGHRDSFLLGLGDVRERDVIRIDTLQGTYTYEVEWGAVVGPNRVDVLDETVAPSLTLVTCYPFLAVGPAPERYVVRATLVGTTEADTYSGGVTEPE
jgi:sortase A